MSSTLNSSSINLGKKCQLCRFLIQFSIFQGFLWHLLKWRKKIHLSRRKIAPLFAIFQTSSRREPQQQAHIGKIVCERTQPSSSLDQNMPGASLPHFLSTLDGRKAFLNTPKKRDQSLLLPSLFPPAFPFCSAPLPGQEKGRHFAKEGRIVSQTWEQIFFSKVPLLEMATSKALSPAASSLTPKPFLASRRAAKNVAAEIGKCL